MNYFEEIQKLCLATIRIGSENGSEYSMLRHLIELLGEEKTNSWIGGWLDYADGDKDFFLTSLHKNLRQDDVFEDGHLDMILWNFINFSDIPFEVFDDIYEKATTKG